MPSDTFKLSYSDSVAPHFAGRSSAGHRTTTNRAASQDCRDVLDRVLRQTVISRLCLAHPGLDHLSAATKSAARGSPTLRVSIDVDGFVAVLRWDDQAAVDRCTEWLEQDGGLDSLLLDLVPRAEAALAGLAARHGATQADVTLGQWRLQELVERLAPRFHTACVLPRHDRRALLSSSEPQHHRLQLQITGEALSRDGWDIWHDVDRCLPELIETVRSEWFAMIVIASETAPVDQMGGILRDLRRASVNPELRIMVMSAALVRRPDRLVRLGADAAAADVRQASVQAQRLLRLMPSRT